MGNHHYLPGQTRNLPPLTFAELRERRMQREANNVLGATAPNFSIPSKLAAEGDFTTSTKQQSFENIIVKDSSNVLVVSVDLQAAIALQAALEAAIVLILEASLADGTSAEKICSELSGMLKTKQTNYRQTYIENSHNVAIVQADIDLLINIQLLLQLLLALAIRLDIL